MSTWSDMNPVQRNHLIGELMKAAPLSQCYMAVDGKRVLVTPYAEGDRGKVDAMLAALRASDDMWAEFLANNSHAQEDWRAKLAVDVDRWHIRYSDTTGGAWCVVEWLREQGFAIDLVMVPKGSELHEDQPYAIEASTERHEFFASGTTMPETICKLFLAIKAPEVLA